MIGNQLTAQQLNVIVGQAAVQLRDACRNVINLQNMVVSQGLTGLEAAPISLDAADAQAITTLVNQLYNHAATYFGLATVPTAFDFDNAASSAYGGQ